MLERRELVHLAGDSIMVFFNDPVPCPDPAARAIRLAAAIRDSMQDLIASQIDLLFYSLDSLPLARSGSIKAYAVTGDTRSVLAPEIPTMVEMGLPAVSYSTWFGFFAPKGTPREIIRRLNATASEALADPAVRGRGLLCRAARRLRDAAAGRRAPGRVDRAAQAARGRAVRYARFQRSRLRSGLPLLLQRLRPRTGPR